MLDFIYHMNLKLLLNLVLREKCQDFIRGQSTTKNL